MNLFGANYIQGELSLQILLLSVLPTIIAGGIGNLVFSYGNYKQSFAIDLVMSVPRTILYFTLIPIYGIIGGAISFLIGSLLALVISVIIISKIRILIFWKDLIIIFIVPLAIGFLFYNLHLYFIVGIFLTIILSYILLLLTNTITGSDVEDFVSILPTRISKQVLTFLKKIKG
jgi:O-antigen/teichoic acid export membrane protein